MKSYIFSATSPEKPLFSVCSSLLGFYEVFKMRALNSEKSGFVFLFFDCWQAFLFSPKVPQNNQLGCVKVSAFTKLFPFRRYSLEILAHRFSLLHLIKLLGLLPNHRSYPRPKFTRLPLLRHVDNAPSFLFGKNRGRRRMLAGFVLRRLGAFDRFYARLKAPFVGKKGAFNLA